MSEISGVLLPHSDNVCQTAFNLTNHIVFAHNINMLVVQHRTQRTSTAAPPQSGSLSRMSCTTIICTYTQPLITPCLPGELTAELMGDREVRGNLPWDSGCSLSLHFYLVYPNSVPSFRTKTQLGRSWRK